MEFRIEGLTLPVRIHPSHPITDDELMRLCAQNEPLNVEREPDGSLLIMTPSNLNTSRKNPGHHAHSGALPV